MANLEDGSTDLDWKGENQTEIAQPAEQMAELGGGDQTGEDKEIDLNKQSMVPNESRTPAEKNEGLTRRDPVDSPNSVPASREQLDGTKRRKGEPVVDNSGMICWEGNRIYVGTLEIGKRANIVPGSNADERVMLIEGKAVKAFKVNSDNVIVKEPRDNKRKVHDSGRIHFDGHTLFVSKSERRKNVWVNAIEKDKVYAIYKDAKMTKEVYRINVNTSRGNEKKIVKQYITADKATMRSIHPNALKPERKVDNNGTIKILEQRFYIKKAKPGKLVWIAEITPTKEYAVYLDKKRTCLARIVTLNEKSTVLKRINVGKFITDDWYVNEVGQINIFNRQIYVGAEYKEKLVTVKEIVKDPAYERCFGVILNDKLVREIDIIGGDIVLDKGITSRSTDNQGSISFEGDRIALGAGFKDKKIKIKPGTRENTYDVFSRDDVSNPLGTIMKKENGKHEYTAKESRLFASQSGVMIIDGQEVKLGLDHPGRAMRVVHGDEARQYVLYEDGTRDHPFGTVDIKDGKVACFVRNDKPAPVLRKVSSSGKTGVYDKAISLHPSYSGKTVTVIEEGIGKRFTIYKDGSLKEKVMTVTIGDDGAVTQRIERVRDYLGKVQDDIAEKVVSLGPARFEELKAAREAGGLVSELARKYGFSFEEMHAVCTSAGVHVKGGDTMADIKDILGHFKPHLKVEGIEDGKAWIKCNIDDHPGFSRPVDQARLGRIECLECAGSSGSGTSLAELTCKRYAEAITGVSFEKAWPPWLKSERGGQMELDMYSKDLNVAIEMNGPHHYVFVAKLHKTKEEVEEWKRSDALKVKQCAEHGKDLIVIPYHEIYEKHRNTVKLRERVHKELNDRGLVRNACENLVYHTYHHGQLYYNFGRKTEKNAVLDNPKLPLKAYLNRVERDVPAGFFKDPDMPRASKQALALPKAEREAIGKAIVQRGLVCKDAEVDMSLPRVAREVMAANGNDGKMHDHVVQRTIQDCKDVVAVEVPVWAKDKSMTGHIDIIRVDKDGDGVPRITIADFKTEHEAEFVHFVPQVEAYVRMLRSQLGEGGDGVLFECVLFNGESSWRWEPGVLERLAVADPSVKRLLVNENVKRNEKIKGNG